MPAKHVVANKNPLHPSALRVGDLTVGRRIIRFNTRLGIVDEYTVVKKPHLGYRFPPSERWYAGNSKALVVALRSRDGNTTNHDLSDLGTTPYYGRSVWNEGNFVIDVRKRHLLPTPNPHPLTSQFMEFEMYEEEEEEEIE